MILNYDYGKALQNEKELDLEVEQLKESLENLKEFLTTRTSLSLKAKQLLLRQQRIIDALVLIAELIDNKIYDSRN